MDIGQVGVVPRVRVSFLIEERQFAAYRALANDETLRGGYAAQRDGAFEAGAQERDSAGARVERVLAESETPGSRLFSFKVLDDL